MSDKYFNGGLPSCERVIFSVGQGFFDPLLGYVAVVIIFFIFASTTAKIQIFQDNCKQVTVKVYSYQQKISLYLAVSPIITIFVALILIVN